MHDLLNGHGTKRVVGSWVLNVPHLSGTFTDAVIGDLVGTTNACGAICIGFAVCTCDTLHAVFVTDGSGRT